jgi:multimeric flavodoxin WrbA
MVIIRIIIRQEQKKEAIMKILVLNGSPKKKGTISILLASVIKDIREESDIEYLDLYDLEMRPCIACMKCRPDGACKLPADDAHRLGEKIRNADALIIGTPTHWGNMSSQLKTLFDRNVPVFMGESKKRFSCPAPER